MPNSPRSQSYQSELDLDPVTLTFKLGIDMVKMSHHTKTEVSTARHSKVIASTDTCRHTHTHTQTHTQIIRKYTLVVKLK